MNLSIIVPCYNEFSRLSLPAFKKFIYEYPLINLCFVNDGSTDNTAGVLNEFSQNFSGNVSVIHLEKNQGKGEAVRIGVNFMLAYFPDDYVCYIDADLSTPLKEAIRLMTIMKDQECLLCTFGSRVCVFGSHISRLSYRHYGGRIVATMIDTVLGLSIYDTQCGLKLFHPKLARKIFELPFITRWLFDVELFARMKKIYAIDDLKYILKEIPLMEWVEKGGSKVKLKDFFWAPWILLYIRSKYLNKSDLKLRNYSTEIIPTLSPDKL